MKKVLIIGFGSIGKRHANVFRELGAEVAVVTKQSFVAENNFKTIPEALISFSPDHIIVANDTASHQVALMELANLGFRGSVMVEKPLGDKTFELQHTFSKLVVSYNLRMSPLLSVLKEELIDKKIIAASIYCGQYLPDWRAGRDYREQYSAKKNQGGGVIRDLSHELDYAQWLLGPMKWVAAHGGHFSSLEIETDDVFVILGESTRCCSVNISVNYLDRIARRTITIQTNQESYYVDLITGRISKNDNTLLENIKTNDTYTEQARRLLNDELSDFCTFDEGIYTMKLIEAAEKSSTDKRFISI